MSPAQTLARTLEAVGIGSIASTEGWRIAVGRTPADPANCVTLFDAGGARPDTDQMDLLRSAVEVRVRASRYDEGYAKAEAIVTALIVPRPAPAFTGIFAETDIIDLGLDDNDRHVFTVTYRCLRRR